MIATATARQAHTTSRELEYFTEKELTLQIGRQPSGWLFALAKEMIDNALDGCESTEVAPEVTVAVDDDNVLSVADNGCGIPPETVRRSLDYSVRVSDKSYYVAPTRGQLGNALKCLWAAPFVLDGNCGRVEVLARGVHHDIRVSMDRLAQKPVIEYTAEPCAVKTGSVFRLHWPQQAGLLSYPKHCDFYRALIGNLIKPYAIFNPHATFRVTHPSGNESFEATVVGWTKWLASWPTSPFWYSEDTLRDLLAASIRADRESAESKPRMLRDLLTVFDGLKGTGKRKDVLETAGLAGKALHDLVKDGDVNMPACRALLEAMRSHVRPLKPQALGVIGEQPLLAGMARCVSISPESMRYKRVSGAVGGLPYVVEAAFGAMEEDEARRILFTGLNWTPTIGTPSMVIDDALQDAIVDDFDPVGLCLHIACPRFAVIDRGKSRVHIPDDLADAVRNSIRLVTREWTANKKRQSARERMGRRDLEVLRKGSRKVMSITEASNQVMAQAYLEVSDNGRYPANARQIMYKARPLVLALTGGKFCKKSATFTQKILPAYLRDNPEQTTDWDVVFDARGHFEEPHTEKRVDLGGIAVRQYCASWFTDSGVSTTPQISVESDFLTSGPGNRYSHALFIEKEGFDPLFRAAGIAERYDVAIMSTKGMSVTASRQLVEKLTEAGVTILVLHDFDRSGFSIFHTLRSDTNRYAYKVKPRVVDIGLRLEDAKDMELPSEPVEYRRVKKDPRIRLRECGANEEECNFLVRQRGHAWVGERVELNAMGSTEFIGFIESQLSKHKVRKVLPEDRLLESVYRRSYLAAVAERAARKAMEDANAGSIIIPEQLRELVEKKIAGSRLAWDFAVADMAQNAERQATFDLEAN